MAKSVKQIINPDEKEAVCRDTLLTLDNSAECDPATAGYSVNCRAMPMWASYDDDELQGFLSLRETSPYAAEIYVMGVKPVFQRHKVGKALFTSMLNYARRQGYEYIQVKVIKQGVCTEYDTANTFYKSLGFRELELISVQEEKIPCQVYIRNVNF